MSVRQLEVDYIWFLKKKVNSWPDKSLLKKWDRTLLTAQIHVGFNKIGGSWIRTDRVPLTREMCAIYFSTGTYGV